MPRKLADTARCFAQDVLALCYAIIDHEPRFPQSYRRAALDLIKTANKIVARTEPTEPTTQDRPE